MRRTQNMKVEVNIIDEVEMYKNVYNKKLLFTPLNI